MKNMSLPILPISAAALRLPIGRLGLFGELRLALGAVLAIAAPTNAALRLEVDRLPRAHVDAAYRSTPTLAETIVWRSRMPDGRPPTPMLLLLLLLLLLP